MADLTTTQHPSLARNRNGEPLPIPPGSVGWIAKLTTGGAPRLIRDETTDDPLVLDLHATMNDLRDVAPEPGLYRLHPVDENRKQLKGVAFAQIPPAGELENLWPPEAYRSDKNHDRIYDVVDRLLASQENRELLTTDIVKTLVTTTAMIQQSTAALLNVANTTIKIANGVEALERQPVQLDVDQLAIQLGEALEDNPGKPQTPLLMQLIQGPLGMAAMQLFSTLNARFSGAARPPQAAPAAQQAAAPARPARASAQPTATHYEADDLDQDEDQDDRDQDAPEANELDHDDTTELDQDAPEADDLDQDTPLADDIDQRPPTPTATAPQPKAAAPKNRHRPATSQRNGKRARKKRRRKDKR